MLPSSHGSLDYYFGFLLIRFGLESFCLSLDRFSGVEYSPSPSRAMVLLFVFSIRFFHAGRHWKGSPVIASGALFFLHLLFEAKSISIR
jgi:hypothetical protein